MISLFHWIAALLTGVLLHPVHETYCEMQWNSETHCVEVALRLHALDAQWIEREFKEEYLPKSVESLAAETKSAEVKTAANDKSPDWRVGFLNDHVLFDPVTKRQQGQSSTETSLRWLGEKQEGAHVWWFFEIKRKDGEKPRRVHSNLLFQRHGDYHHRVVILDQAGKAKGQAIVLHRERSQSPIDL